MFRILDNVPEIYINESRDFLLISRLYDLLFSSVKYDIDSMVNVLDATLVKDSMLQLMCSKVGFFPRIEIDANVLKYIIASFPYILKYKGSRRGIEFAVNSILKAENDPNALGEPFIDIHRKKIADGDSLLEYTVYIYTSVSIYNKRALDEVLRYVIPSGMNYLLLLYHRIPGVANHPTILSQHDAAKISQVIPLRAGSIRSSRDNYLLELNSRLVGAFDTSQIVSHLDFTLFRSDYNGSIYTESENEKSYYLDLLPELLESEDLKDD